MKLEQQAGRSVPRDARGSGDQRNQEERRVRTAGSGPSGEVEPQGAHGPQSANRRSNQDSCQDRGEVPRGQGRERLDRTQEVVVCFLNRGRLRAGLLHSVQHICARYIAAKKPSHGCTPGIVRRNFPLSSESRSFQTSSPAVAQALQLFAAVAQLICRHCRARLLRPRPRSLRAPVNTSSKQRVRRERAAASAARRMPTCRACKSPRSSGVSRHLISGLRASVPVPEHGTSASTRSKPPCKGSCSASALMTCDVGRAYSLAQQIGAMRVQFRRNDLRRGIARRQRSGLAAGSGAAVEQARTCADQRGNQLRSFVLDEDAAFAKRARSGYVSSRRRCARWPAVLPGASSMPSLSQLLLDLGAVETNRVLGMRWSCLQIACARSAPNSATQRSTSHSGCANSRAKNGIGSPMIVSGDRLDLRRRLSSAAPHWQTAPQIAFARASPAPRSR